MIYADYDYYLDSYLNGKESKVPRKEFEYYARKASAILQNYISMGLEFDEENIPEELQLCTCEVVEDLYAYDESNGNSSVTSEKVGEYSVSYATQADRQQQLRNTIQQRVYDWLGPTGLLFRGVF